ncbi:hypothetical protein Aspvir_003180 [Aspergillus viridinutans]|uniref:O-methyltransferase domain-containing protein n=1 Tax=Aspergillus viridinutans TaxID=75553 RepID=A0A9P3F701_ASPVI|nr:uncharacterized protein Aspvir_003180 [Aspergillus viridinutans]GIK07514.1 hypothetical protein Aspvir_003180 [Aspergillus viridinutans]
MSVTKSQILEQVRQIQTIAQSMVETWDDSKATDPSTEWSTSVVQLQQAAEELISLTASPRSVVRTLQLTHYDLVAYQVALEFDLFTAIPADGELSLAQVAEKAGIDEDRVARVLRLLALHGMFQETQEDTFAHTPLSRFIAENESVRAALGIQMDEMYQAASSTADAIRKNPRTQDVNTSPFATRFGVSIYDFYTKYKSKADRFGRGMMGASSLEDEGLISLRDCYNWAALAGGKIVDVGGGMGHVSIFLANHFPGLSFVVQDILVPPGIDTGDNKLADNVEFQQHDFFQSQPVTDARAYLLKHALHNHSDEDCVKVLAALVPALEAAGPKAALLINEGVLPDYGQAMSRDQHLTLRRGDMCMMVTLSAKERTRKQFQNLLRAADPRFKIHNVYGNAVTRLIEVYLSGSE